jgi:hypothetical protein
VSRELDFDVAVLDEFCASFYETQRNNKVVKLFVNVAVPDFGNRGSCGEV